MQICKEHYEQMKQAVKDRGMWPLVPDLTAEELHQREVDSLHGIKTTWDPLIAMVWNFYARALDQGGLYLMASPPADAGFVNDRGERHYCPLCEVELHAQAATNWIDTCADAMLDHARSENLIPGVQ